LTNPEVNSRAIRNATYKLIYFDSSKVQEFYNLTTDANERTNLLTRTMSTTELTNYNYLCTEMGTLLGKTICNTKVDTKDLNATAKPIIAPNPAKSIISVSFNDALSFDFQITSMDGKMIKSGISIKEINVSDLPNGLFLLKIQKQGDVFLEKIVVEH
jgi:hypothetical protein